MSFATRTGVGGTSRVPHSPLPCTTRPWVLGIDRTFEHRFAAVFREPAIEYHSMRSGHTLAFFWTDDLPEGQVLELIQALEKAGIYYEYSTDRNHPTYRAREGEPDAV